MFLHLQLKQFFVVVVDFCKICKMSLVSFCQIAVDTRIHTRTYLHLNISLEKYLLNFHLFEKSHSLSIMDETSESLYF